MRPVNELIALAIPLLSCSCGGATEATGAQGPDGASHVGAEAGIDAQGDADASTQPSAGEAQSDSGGLDAFAADGPSSLSGSYSGYVESFMFPDGSDTLFFTLAFLDDGTVTGTVRFGNAPLLAPPTDP